MGILSGMAIDDAVASEKILISPYDARLLNPASIDVTLGRTVRCYDFRANHGWALDAKKEVPTFTLEIPDDGFTIQPGTLYLMHTEERVRTDCYVPCIEGKSSIGRLGIFVHATAGYGDPGFDGQYTLEVTSIYPVRVYPGMRFAQMRFSEIAGKVVLYAGNYGGEFSRGPVASRSWKQFT